MFHRKRWFHRYLFKALLLALCAGLFGVGVTTSIPVRAVSGSTPFGAITAPDDVGLYHKFEISLELNAAITNPYDPGEAALDGEFTSPSGKILTVPGFYYRDFDFSLVISELGNIREQMTPMESRSWRVRFTPSEVGIWHFALLLTHKGETVRSESRQFAVKESDKHGFLRLSPRDPRYLEFDDGTPFFGVGLNMAWYEDNEDGRIADYVRWLDAFSAAGGNTIRVWLAPWGFSYEWRDTGLGNYELRQDRAFRLDKLFELAEERGVYIQLTMIAHGPFSRTTNTEWDANPYNQKNGGMLSDPVAFVSNPEAFNFWLRYLRYAAARWGYSTSLLAWEWWNEVNWTPFSSPEKLAPWISKSAEYLKNLDPYQHLITHSGSQRQDKSVWGMPSMDITQVHIYQANDWAFTLVEEARKWSEEYGKAFLLGEFGYDSTPQLDPFGVRMRIGMWSGLVGGAMGSGQFWWWYTYVHAGDLYQPFRGLSAFVKGEDFAAHGFRPSPAKSSKRAFADVYGLQSDDYALLWVVSGTFSDAYYKRLVQKNMVKKVENPLIVTFPTVKGISVNVPELKPGSYTVEIWDTLKGEVIATQTLNTTAEGLSIPLPEFMEDLALKVRKVN